MKFVTVLVFLFGSLLGDPQKIAVCMVAGGQNVTSAQSLIESGRRFFCVNHEVTYFVFTDGEVEEAKDVTRVAVTPDRLKPMHIFDEHQKCFERYHYIFAIHPNMLFVAPVGNEILSLLVAVQDPNFIGKSPLYFTTRFLGGNREEFFKLVKTVKKEIDQGMAINNFSCIEKHLNRYLTDHPPTRVLSPSYCYPEDWKIDFPKTIVSKYP